MEVLCVAGDTVTVRNEEGKQWQISTDIVANECYSASQYTEEKKVTRSELSSVLRNAGDTCFEARFEKQVTAKQVADVLKEVHESEPDTFAKPAKRRKLAAMLTTGADRTLVGYAKHDAEGRGLVAMGRSKVQDLEARGERLIDHRTLKSMTVKNIKYTLK